MTLYEAITSQVELWTTILANLVTIAAFLGGVVAAGPTINWFLELRAEVTLVRRKLYVPTLDTTRETVEVHRQIRLGTPSGDAGDSWSISWTGYDNAPHDNVTAYIISRRLRYKLMRAPKQYIGAALSGEVRYTRGANPTNVEITHLDYMDGDKWSEFMFRLSRRLKRLLAG